MVEKENKKLEEAALRKQKETEDEKERMMKEIAALKE